MSFNEKLQKLRKQNGLSQEGLADLLDVTRQSVSKWESGTTYPEMDKLLAMCKIFKCTLDDLTNDEITEIKVEEKKKSNIYTFIDSVLDFIKETYQLFQTMTRKELASCIVVMGITAMVLLLFGIPFHGLNQVLNSILPTSQNDLLYIGSYVTNLVINCCYWSLFLVIFIYIFRVVYLEGAKYQNREVKKETIIEKKVVIEKPVNNPPTKITNRIDTLFRFLEKATMLFVKTLICCIILPTLFILFFLCAALFIYLYLLSQGIFYLSVLLGILFSILFVLTILEVLICFVIDRRMSEKRLLITFFLSIIGLGSSFGIFLLDLNSMEYIDEAPKGETVETWKHDYEMTDDLYFLFSDMAVYQIDDTPSDIVRVEIKYYSDYIKLFEEPTLSSFPYYEEQSYIFMNKRLISIMMKDLKERKIHNYSKLQEVEITIYANEKNAEKLQQNYQKEQQKMEQQTNMNYEQNLKRQIEELVLKVEQLEQEKEQLNYEKESSQQQILELQSEIEEYKQKIERLQNVIAE